MYALKGKIRYSNDVTTVYRQHDSSAYASLENGKMLMWRMRAKSFIHFQIHKRQMDDFYTLNKHTFLSIFQDQKIENKEFKEFFLYLEKQGVPKIGFLAFLFAGRKIGVLNSILFRHFNKKH